MFSRPGLSHAEQTLILNSRKKKYLLCNRIMADEWVYNIHTYIYTKHTHTEHKTIYKEARYQVQNMLFPNLKVYLKYVYVRVTFGFLWPFITFVKAIWYDFHMGTIIRKWDLFNLRMCIVYTYVCVYDGIVSWWGLMSNIYTYIYT